jgi:hypothetical protein
VVEGLEANLKFWVFLGGGVGGKGFGACGGVMQVRVAAPRAHLEFADGVRVGHEGHGAKFRNPFAMAIG